MLPPWLRRPLALQGQFQQAKELTRTLRLHTVCEEARCPNLGECWSKGNVSFMIGGDRCTRRCSFCAVTTARPEAVDWEEPSRLALAVEELHLEYVVVTSVARDDLADEGAGLFAACITAIKKRVPSVCVEVLTPDFHARPELIEQVLKACPAVFNHNLETVSCLSRRVRPQADYQRSLRVLEIAKKMADSRLRTKSGLMVGLGERPSEVRQAMQDLRAVGCDILTIGQYLRPSYKQPEVAEFVPPEQFSVYQRWGRELGFHFVASAPYVRSSYNAYEALMKNSKEEIPLHA